MITIITNILNWYSEVCILNHIVFVIHFHNPRLGVGILLMGDENICNEFEIF